MGLRSRGMDVGTVEQWASAGVPVGRLRTKVRRGELVRLRHGTYATAAAVMTATARGTAARHALDVRAALASMSRTRIVASHESAALVHDLPLLHAPADGSVSLTVPPGSLGGRRAADIRCHAAELPDDHVMRKLGLSVTTPARTVIDLARALPFMDGVVVADAAFRTRKTRKSELVRVLRACEGWPGADRARRVVDFSNGASGSPLESCARVIFDAFGLPPPELQAEIIVGINFSPDGTATVDEYHEYRVDFLWREFRTVAETDGRLKYGSGQDAINERKRDRLIREQGYKVVHVMWAELHQRPQRIIDRILTAFSTASAY